MLDIYEKALKDIRKIIKSGDRARSKEAIEKAAKKLYGSKNK
jgi:cell division septal protein FtsQ